MALLSGPRFRMSLAWADVGCGIRLPLAQRARHSRISGEPREVSQPPTRRARCRIAILLHGGRLDLEGERLQGVKEQREKEHQVVIKSHLCSDVRQGWQ